MSEGIALQSCENLWTFIWWWWWLGGKGGGGSSFRPHHTNVCKISRLWGAVSSMVVNKSLSNLAILLTLRRSFHWCRRFVLTCPCQKLKKSRKAYWEFADRKYGPQPEQGTAILLTSTQMFLALFPVLSCHADEENSRLNLNIWS